MERQTIFLYTDWKFREGFDPMGYYKGLDDSSWQTVCVPHDASVMYPFDRKNSSGTGYLPGGSFFYRRRFSLPKERGKVYITFEGVYNNAKVWINSNYLGKHPYGYSTFTYDITEFAAEDNTVSIFVDRPETADSRWYTGTGITRRVFVTLCGETSVVPYSLFVTTPSVTEERASLHVELETTKPCGVRCTVLDGEEEIASGGCELVIENPSLWSPENPHLYTLKTELISSGKVCDTLLTTFGVRFFSFDPDKGFFLNGKSVKLKGVCVHHDAGALGAAVPCEVWRDRLRKLKDCGANALRTSHNPPDPTLLDLCDEMGFLVMDEAFDEWEGPKNKWWQGHNVYPPKHFGYYEDFPEWGEKDIKSMVLRDRNHPSVIMWSIGNEIDYPNDPYCHPSFSSMTGNNDSNKPERERMYDLNKPNAERLAVIARKLVSYVKECDLTRPVTSALAFPELSTETGYFQALDICGYNYKEHLYEKDHARFPGSVIYGSENSHRFSAWKAVRDNDYIAGQFLWTGIDYMGEAHGWPVRASMPGLLDMAGFKKPSWHFRKTLWTNEPYVYICAREAPKSDERRPPHFCEHWNFAEGCEAEILCYTNCDSVELKLNGISLGSQSPDDEHERVLLWRTAFKEGTLTALSDGARCSLKTSGKPEILKSSASKLTISPDGYDTVRIELFAADNEGNPALFADDIIQAQLSGRSAVLSGMENGCGHDLTPYSSPFRRLHNGRLALYLKSTGVKGETTLTLFAPTMGAETSVTITAQ